MITDSYRKEPGKMTPENVLGPGKNITDVCITTFSCKLMAMIIEEYHPEVVADLVSTNGHTPIYAITYKGKRFVSITRPWEALLLALI
jgi:hypothetical protein